jgi:hypothetical protein
MKYALIDNDGELHIKDGEYRAEVGPEGPAAVNIPPMTWAPVPWFRGWVNDCGLVPGFEETYPRNLIGGLVLISMGAGAQPYAGPVVITGWDLRGHGDGPETRDLGDDQIAMIREIHADARRAMAGEAGESLDSARAVAEWMRSAPAPGINIISGADFLGGGR